MNGSAFQQAAKEMDSFFATAIDINLGSERFYSYLPENIRALFRHPDRKIRMYMPPGAVDLSWREELAKETALRGVKPGSLDGLDEWREELSDDELRQFVALTFDLTVQSIWFLSEGLEGIRGTNLQSKLLVSNPRDYIKMLEQAVMQNRNLMEASGLLTPEHLRLTSSYMKQMISGSPIAKESSLPKPCPCFSLPSSGDSAMLYLVSIGPWLVHFGRVGADLRIVCVALN